MNPSSGSIEAVPFAVDAGRESLHGLMWRAARPAASVLVVHGLGEHCGRYAAFASAQAEAGLTTAAVDWPGHGRSPGPRGHASWLAMRDAIIPAALNRLAAEVPGAAPLLFGHSMGGAMALDYALAHASSITAVVVSAPAVRTARPQWWKLAAARLLRIVAPGLGIPHDLPVEALSRDPEVIERYRADPLVNGTISAQLYFDLLDAQRRILGGASSIAVPALVVAGTADEIVDWTGARDFAAAAQPCGARFVQVPGAFHELLSDSDRDEVLRRILEFWESQLRTASV